MEKLKYEIYRNGDLFAVFLYEDDRDEYVNYLQIYYGAAWVFTKGERET